MSSALTARPLPKPKVYLERGDSLVSQAVSSDGSYRFDNVETGVSGVFAIAEGYAYGGATVNMGMGDALPDLVIRLGEVDSVSGKVVDPKGKPISGARITGIALLGDTKVGVPLAKLEKDGVKIPVSAADGRFTIPQIPKGQTIAVKVNHVAFAQEAAGNIAAGERNVRIAMNPGVLVRGNVLTRDRSAAVMNATISIKNNQPPYDSLSLVSSPAGTFELRLKPGIYLCQAVSAQYRSPGLEQILLTGEQPEQKVTLRLAGMVPLHGKVLDAVSGGPRAGSAPNPTLEWRQRRSHQDRTHWRIPTVRCRRRKCCEARFGPWVSGAHQPGGGGDRRRRADCGDAELLVGANSVVQSTGCGRPRAAGPGRGTSGLAANPVRLERSRRARARFASSTLRATGRRPRGNGGASI